MSTQPCLTPFETISNPTPCHSDRVKRAEESRRRGFASPVRRDPSVYLVSRLFALLISRYARVARVVRVTRDDKKGALNLFLNTPRTMSTHRRHSWVLLLGFLVGGGVIASLLAFFWPDPVYTSGLHSFRVETFATGLDTPWGMVFLPDGRMLVTERPGNLRIVDADGTVSEPIAGVPEVCACGQGGMLDVQLHPNYEENGWLYLAYSDRKTDGGSAVGFTAVMRALNRPYRST